MTARELIIELMDRDIDYDVCVKIEGHLFQVDALDLSADKKHLIIQLSD